jgi:hypothetical protein
MYNNQKRYLIKRIGGWKKLADMIIIEMDLFGNRVLKYSLDALEQARWVWIVCIIIYLNTIIISACFHDKILGTFA